MSEDENGARFVSKTNGQGSTPCIHAKVYMLNCRKLIDAGFAKSCCSSCHDDSDEGYSELCELYDPSGKLIGWVCCSVASAISIDDQWDEINKLI